MLTYKKMEMVYFFKLEIIFFEFRLLLENHKKLLNFRKSVIKDNGLKTFRKNE